MHAAYNEKKDAACVIYLASNGLLRLRRKIQLIRELLKQSVSVQPLPNTLK